MGLKTIVSGIRKNLYEKIYLRASLSCGLS